MANTQAYNDTAKIAAVKRFLVQAPGVKFAGKAGAFPGGALQNSTLQVQQNMEQDEND